jgi:hypothetical protein
MDEFNKNLERDMGKLIELYFELTPKEFYEHEIKRR